jgi:hypothetical protein
MSGLWFEPSTITKSAPAKGCSFACHPMAFKERKASDLCWWCGFRHDEHKDPLVLKTYYTCATCIYFDSTIPITSAFSKVSQTPYHAIDPRGGKCNKKGNATRDSSPACEHHATAPVRLVELSG